MEIVERLNLPNCLRLSSGEIELIVTTDVGPRIIGYSLVGGENVLGEHPEAKVETALGTFKPYGGHRLWIAPENMPNSYAPDNQPVEYFYNQIENSVRLVQPVESVTKTQKEIIIKLDETGTGVSINHRIHNRGTATIEIAAWALTIMRGGGICEIPNEPFAAYGSGTLMPVRNFSLWSYTDFTDPRWQFDKDFIRLKVDAAKSKPQKIGVLNKQGWAAYRVGNLRFVKRFAYVEGANYPDMNSNTELYTAGDFVEIESLASLLRLAPGEATEHLERWELTAADEA